MGQGSSTIEERARALPSFFLNLNAREPREKEQPKEVVMQEIWIQHYSSSHKILLVGEGDFSFSASLARAFNSAANMVATSLDSLGFLCANYTNAMSNINELMSRGCTVMHGLDVTEMANHYWLKQMEFDRIIFNFPLAGFFPDKSKEFEISQHQSLIRLFLKNAKKLLSEEGEIHITHKSWGFFLDWNLEQIASFVGLQFIEELPFNFKDYTGYRTKYGFGGDKNFNCNPSKTYKFRLKPEEIEFEGRTHLVADINDTVMDDAEGPVLDDELKGFKLQWPMLVAIGTVVTSAVMCYRHYGRRSRSRYSFNNWPILKCLELCVKVL